MGVATYKTADEMNPELLKVLPLKEELQKLSEESHKKEEEVWGRGYRQGKWTSGLSLIVYLKNSSPSDKVWTWFLYYLICKTATMVVNYTMNINSYVSAIYERNDSILLYSR